SLPLSSSGYAACNIVHGVCEPSVDDGRAKLEQLLNSAFLTPHSLDALEKLDGRSFETQDRKMYEMRFLAVVTYSGDTLRCRNRLCPELPAPAMSIGAMRQASACIGLARRADQFGRLIMPMRHPNGTNGGPTAFVVRTNREGFP